MKRSKKNKSLFTLILIFLVALFTYFKNDIYNFLELHVFSETYASLSSIPAYDGNPYVYLNDNKPLFTEEDYNTKELEKYSNLDLLGRAGVAFAKVGLSTMPTEERGSISGVKPSGWHTIKYDFIDGKYLYNRCHLIGYQLTGENANEKNLITCTRSTNTKSMLTFENKVANYVKDTNNQVLYRVTPIYEGANLIASGIEIEAASFEDRGKSLSFHVYIYNVEDGVEINYKTGESKAV